MAYGTDSYRPSAGYYTPSSSSYMRPVPRSGPGRDSYRPYRDYNRHVQDSRVKKPSQVRPRHSNTPRSHAGFSAGARRGITESSVDLYQPPNVPLNREDSSTSSDEGYAGSRDSSTGSSTELEDEEIPSFSDQTYLDIVYQSFGKQDLTSVNETPGVLGDYKRNRSAHWGSECASQFNLSLSWVRLMLQRMHAKFDTMSFCSMGLVEPGMIIYYNAPYILGFDQEGTPGSAYCGGDRFSVKVECKGRFAVVVDKFVNSHSFSVAQSYTFNKQGLQSKPRRMHADYVGLQSAEVRDFWSPSPHQTLEVAESVIDIDPMSSVHLMTEQISLSNHILYAGRVTDRSLDRLRALIKETETAARR
jgi:hypothetical protein